MIQRRVCMCWAVGGGRRQAAVAGAKSLHADAKSAVLLACASGRAHASDMSPIYAQTSRFGCCRGAISCENRPLIR
jgi:hypothetical protein